MPIRASRSTPFRTPIQTIAHMAAVTTAVYDRTAPGSETKSPKSPW